MDVPPEVTIKGTIQPGSVYYFPHEKFTSTESHFFIVINLDPYSDEVILLVCSSSQIRKVKKRNRYTPAETLVVIKEEEYADFTCDSIINCNNVLQESIDSLIKRLTSRKLDVKSEMAITLVEKLRQGVLASNQVPIAIKEQLRPA